MRSIALLFVVVATTQAAVLTGHEPIPILKQSNEINPDGSYSFSFEAGNGIYVDGQGFQKAPDTHIAQGQYQYQSPEGENIHISYIADENGYQPQGNSLPTPPPIPEPILRALKYIAEHPPVKEHDI